jgi:hypothetical protein
VAITRNVVAWYVERYFRTSADPGVLRMFVDERHLGAFAIAPDALAEGRDEALFKLLIATAMFQRRQDAQIVRILRSLSANDVDELGDKRRLLHLVDTSPCEFATSNERLLADCDLAKDRETRAGCCDRRPATACHLKRHTVLLKRYGHFGKMPTSAALLLREAGVPGLNDLRRNVYSEFAAPLDRARALERRLSGIWRVNSKIACMFLSAVTNPDLSGSLATWSDGIDWTHFVIVDSNVDAFLASVRYTGTGTYDARREFVQRLAERIDLRELDSRLHSYNPRLVQQAMYVFMSAANRRNASVDCSRIGAPACRTCPSALVRRCALACRGQGVVE